jgi:nucleoside-diphosphate-sugar epimerase
MKILITGVAGFIGSHLSECLAKHGHEVVGIDNLSDYYDVKLKQDNVECIKKAGVHFIKADLQIPDEYSNIGNDFDFIYHLAAQPGLSKDLTFESYLNNNVVATKTLIEFTKAQKQLKHFFYISTSSVYGKYATVSEEVAPQPISTYGITKLAAEQMVLSESRQHHFRASSYRLYSVYGPRERPDKLFTKLIYCGLNDLKFPLFEGSFKHERSFTYVDDIVNALVNTLIVHNILDGEIINLGHFQKNSTQDGILIVERLLKKHIQIEVLAPRDGDQQQTQANIGKAKLLLNYHPKTSFEAGIRQQIEWYKSKIKTLA